MRFVVSNVPLVGGVSKHFPNSVDLPVHLAMGIFAAKAHQFTANLFVAITSGIQFEDFLNSIRLFRINNIGPIDTLIVRTMIQRAKNDLTKKQATFFAFHGYL